MCVVLSYDYETPQTSPIESCGLEFDRLQRKNGTEILEL